ncbi:zinc metalloprotease TldD [Sulfolobus acidocaldarius]|uniref:Conserved Archaeal protein n=4 Tax=Sulfolobus acidocaldarius TaxID=2285 RepID=Q4J8D3_SULAC|nr:zinc metalloprotease TldD [Sulfolobus acidocaldarius]AAY80949.1 conserved Archaeal protein [Sulfolobus acidocaldarius DSM 639]AGE71550.1 hypothetical protein SacN8_07950 [Sulfolobus acidocaldarius N8]AGE73823.1 hypothetical protein SacRon12I_07960 [Sulfolobus acidocaldarius Ron12/I]ALU30223.1 Zn-dependent protease [Sulfolobus acidocaldarius]ALU30938.1 Zn-dependent protease [Sulfolobus acidocaldarius]
MDVLARAESYGATFADLRYFKSKGLSLVVTEDREQVSSYGTERGYSLRVLYRNNWGYFSSSKEIEEENVKQAINSAVGNENVNIILLPSKHDEIMLKPRYEVSKSVHEKMEDLKRLRQKLFDLDSRIKSVTIRYAEEEIRKEYYSTEGREIKQSYYLSGISINVIAREGDTISSAYHRHFSYQGYPFEVFNEEEILDTVKMRINNQFIGLTPKAGLYTVILSPDVSGVFAHEAIGHLAEADLSTNGILFPLRGKKIAPDSVTIMDSPLVQYPEGIGVTLYDDEGVEGRDVKIIDKGVVKESLTDRFYSLYLGQKPTGNARSEDFKSPVLIRMRNTYFAPGDISYQEILRETKNGILLVSPSGGQTSPDGTFQFGIQESYLIENGEISKPLKTVGISGYTLETLKSVVSVSKEFNVFPGFCGKDGQSVPVGTGGPYVKVEKVKVGGIVG